MKFLPTHALVSTSLVMLLAACGDDSSSECAAPPGAEYPVTRTVSAGQLEQFEQREQDFRAAYPPGDFVVERLPAITSPTIRGDGSITIARGSLEPTEARGALSGFLDRWRDFLDPYDAELTSEITCGDRLCGLSAEQTMCGREIREVEGKYEGNLQINVELETAEVIHINSTLLPTVPLPSPALDAREATEIVRRTTIETTCYGSLSFDEDSCIEVEGEAFVWTRESPSNPDAAEFRLATEVRAERTCGEELERFFVTVDLVDATVLHSRDEIGCDS